MIRLLLAILTLAAAAPAVHAACGNVSNACNLTAADFNTCCGGSLTCDVTGQFSVPANAVCTIDFGPRAVRFKSGGSLQVGPGSVTLLAGSVTVMNNSQLTALGTTTVSGGTIRIGTPSKPVDGFTLSDTGLIDVSGGGPVGAGLFEVNATGAINLSGGNITANAVTNASDANGGTVNLSSTGGDVNINANIHADANNVSDGIGAGGTITVEAGGNLSLRNSRSIEARGGLANIDADIELTATGAVVLEQTSSIDASAYVNTEGDGGEIHVLGGSIDANGTISSEGGSAVVTADGGGSGGQIELDAKTGHLKIIRTVGGLSVDGSPGGDGGEVDLTTEAPTKPDGCNPNTAGSCTTDGTLTLGAAVAANGIGSSQSIGAGGDLEISSNGDFTLLATSPITLNGDGDIAGTIDVDARRDITLGSSITANGDGGGGELTIHGHHDIVFNAPVSMSGLQSLAAGGGGSIEAVADNNVQVNGAGDLTAVGQGGDDGGTITLSAGARVRVESGALVQVDAGSTGTAPAGAIAIISNTPNLGGPAAYSGADPSFDQVILGKLTANGHNPTCSGSFSSGGRIRLDACRLRIAGIVDSHGDCTAANVFNVRQAVTVSGATVKTQGGGSSSNQLNFKNAGTFPVVSLGNVTAGNFTPAYQATGVAECTAANTPPGCLAPCPTCGDGVTSSPWEQCDAGAGNSRCGACNQYCQAVNCTQGNACKANDCDLLGGCIGSNLPDGTTCDDGNACTLQDKCVSGSCTHQPLDCDDDNPCTVDGCNAASGCTHTNNAGPDPQHPGQSVPGCDDGHLCDGPETCVGGVCTAGPPPTCDDGDPDSRDFCQNDVCQNQFKGCTTVADCDDGNQCTTDTCVDAVDQVNHPGKICRNTAVNNNTPCTDNDGCTLGDACQSGTCVSGSPKNCDDGQFCTTDSCIVATGACVNAPVGGGCCDTAGQCDDGNPCTTDTCDADHECAHAPKTNCCLSDADCDDANVCTQEPAGICNMQTNQCGLHNPLPPTVACGDACNPATCTPANGTSTCVAGTPTSCPDDNDVCTVDYCDSLLGCQHQVVAGCCHTVADCPSAIDTCHEVACNDGHTCDQILRFADCTPCAADTDCDELGRCVGKFCGSDGTCQSTTVPNCNDGDTNTRDSCVLDGSNQPVCQHACLNDTPCDDGNACNGHETCSGGTCHAGSTPDCDDHDVCTTDSCDAAAGCLHVSLTGIPRVTCCLDDLAAQIGAISGVPAKSKKKATTLLAGIRAKLTKIQLQETGGKAKGAKRTVKAAAAQSRKLDALFQTLARKGKIPTSAAADIHSAVGDVVTQIGTLAP